MSAGREELRRLVAELSEDEIPAVLWRREVPLHAGSNRPWPPAWFGAAQGRTMDAAARSGEMLREGFGQA